MLNRQFCLEEAVEDLRERVSEFCLNECSGECCRWGYEIEVTNREAEAIFGVLNINGIEDDRLEYYSEGKFLISLGPCPALVSNRGKYKCGIHFDSSRPKGCRDYPIFIEENKVFFDGRCSAIYSGEFDKQIERFRGYGVDIEVKR